MTGYKYDSTFFDYVSISATASARALIDELLVGVKPASVLDVGCGRGVWVAEWMKRGIEEALGIDGDYVDRDALVIPASAFQARDISQQFRLGRKYDLVQCLEVAEHIPAADADTLVENLVVHGDIVLFSAATPGQGGEFHVNEQLPQYWLGKFSKFGCRAFDFLRPRIYQRSDIEPWYRYNVFLFANEDGRSRLPRQVLDTVLPEDRAVPQYASLSWRLRCGLVRLIPPSLVQALAQRKHKLVRYWKAAK
jgi:SAM-dependent methyltransferase